MPVSILIKLQAFWSVFSSIWTEHGEIRPATLLETLAQVFSCEFCEISKNTLSYRIPPITFQKQIFEEARYSSGLLDISPS